MKWLSDFYFAYWNDFIYYINEINSCKCLCILICFKKKIFELAHNHQHHDEFHRTYNWIIISLFIHHFTQHLKTYIFYCSDCQLNQIKQYVSYESLHSILMLTISFHIITMNFILTLSSNEDLNNLLTVTDKFIKCVLFLFDWSTVSDWANILLSELIKYDWDILHQIIND